MDQESIIQGITSLLDRIQDWEPESFDFNPPVSHFSNHGPVINVDNMIKPPETDECRRLAKDASGRAVRLNRAQLEQLRESGTFSVCSTIPNQQHTWRVNRLVQSGTDHITDSFYNYLALSLENIIIGIPNRVYKGSHVTIVRSGKELASGFWNIPLLIFGWNSKKPTHTEYQMNNILKEFLLDEVIRAVVKRYDYDNKMIYLEPDGRQGRTVEQYKEMVKQILEPYNIFMAQQNKNKVARRNQLYNNYSDQPLLSKEEILKNVANEESIMLQQEILRIIQDTLQPDCADALTNLVMAVSLLRNELSKYHKEQTAAIESYERSLKAEHSILYRIPTWKDRKMAEFEEKWLRDHSLHRLKHDIYDRLGANQEAQIFGANLHSETDIKYLNFKTKLETQKEPERTFIFKFRIWNPKSWKIINNNGYYHLEKYTNVTNKTTYPGWRISNFFLRIAKYFNNGTNSLVSNAIFGPFGLRSLYGLGEFDCDYKVDNEGHLVAKYRLNTWFGRIGNLWRNISKSRREFEAKEENGLLGKSFTRIFNWLWNYLGKGLFGTVLIGAGHPLLVFLNSVLSIIGFVSSPVWVLGSVLFVCLWNLFIYDTDAPADQELKFMPLVRALIEKILIKGIGQFVVSVGAIAYHGLAALLILTWAVFVASIRHSYDFAVYHCILKFKAKIPSEDDFLVKRVSGPGLSSKYFYLATQEFALLMLQFQLESMEMEAYKHEMRNRINAPRNQLLYLLESFNGVGLQHNPKGARVQAFTETRSQLEKQMEEIEKKFWTSHKIRGSIREKDKIRLDQNNLAMAIQRGAQLCRDFVPEHIFSRMDAGYFDSFWVSRGLEQNDWNGLAIHCYRLVFGDSIMTPFENIDSEGFHLVVEEHNVKQFVDSLFEGEPSDGLNTVPINPLVNLHDSAKSDTKVVDLENLFSNEQFESMLMLHQITDEAKLKYVNNVETKVNSGEYAVEV